MTQAESLAGIAVVALVSLGVGCDRPITNAVFDNKYGPDSGLVVYQAQWSAVMVSTPVPPGSSSAPQDTVPTSPNPAWVALAPGWDPTSTTPPTTVVVLQSVNGFEVHLNNALHIPVDDQSFAGNCAAGNMLTQDQADFITQRVFQSVFAGLSYDAATCTTKGGQ